VAEYQIGRSQRKIRADRAVAKMIMADKGFDIQDVVASGGIKSTFHLF